MKRSIFKHVLCLLVLAASFSSCKKESSTPNSVQFKAKFDGTEKVFSKMATASKTNLGVINSLILIGVSDTETISINLWSEADDFTAGKVYTIVAPAGSENSLSYGPTGSTTGTNAYFTQYLYSPVTEKFDCAITEANAGGIKGTFSGYIYKNQSGTPQRIEVTDGTFYAKF